MTTTTDDMMGESTVLRAMADLNGDYSGFDSCSNKKEGDRGDKTLMNHTDKDQTYNPASTSQHQRSVMGGNKTMGDNAKTISFNGDKSNQGRGGGLKMNLPGVSNITNGDDTMDMKEPNTSNNDVKMDNQQPNISNKDVTMDDKSNDETNALNEDDVRIFEGLTFAVFVDEQKEEVCACIQDFGGFALLFMIF